MKIKDIKRKPGRLANEEAIRFLYFLFDWDGYYCDFIRVKAFGSDEVRFDNSEEARAFIDDLELEKLDRIICDFRTHAITRFEIGFNYNGLESPGYAIMNITSREK